MSHQEVVALVPLRATSFIPIDMLLEHAPAGGSLAWATYSLVFIQGKGPSNQNVFSAGLAGNTGGGGGGGERLRGGGPGVDQSCRTWGEGCFVEGWSGQKVCLQVVDLQRAAARFSREDAPMQACLRKDASRKATPGGLLDTQTH